MIIGGKEQYVPAKRYVPTVYWCHPDENFKLEKKTKGSVGYDLAYYTKVGYSNLVISYTPTVLDTGVRLYLKYTKYGAEIRGRSSLSMRGYLVYHGTVDLDYTGSLGVIMQKVYYDNHGLRFKEGDRIAQLVINEPHTLSRVDSTRFEDVVKKEVESGENERGSKGFGSTGQ